ncbi:MAG: AAA family ATPase, partial [Paraclostridium sp.]
IGNAGTGKTTLMQSLQEVEELGIDEVIIFRLQGLSSEDFRVPTIDRKIITKNGETREEKYIEFTNVGVFKDIIDNPNKKYLLVLDEITRAGRDVVPLLFSMLEGKLMDGIKRDNLYIITAFNDGDDYIMNFNFEDPALRRRQIFVEYEPDIEDFKQFIAKNEYHPIIQEMAEYLTIENVIDHNVYKDKEQTTTFGSWSIFNSVIKDLEKNGKQLTYLDLRDEFTIFGCLYFNDKTIKKAIDVLTILDSLNTIDYQAEIIEKLGLLEEITIYDKKGKVYNKSGKTKSLAIKTLNFIKKEVLNDSSYFAKNCVNIIKNFEFEQALMLSLIGQIKNEVSYLRISQAEKEKLEDKIFKGFITGLNNYVKENPKENMAIIKEFKTICDLRK